MDNQTVIEDQSIQQVEQNSVHQPTVLPVKPKRSYLSIGLVMLVGFVIVGLGGYYLGRYSTMGDQTKNPDVLVQLQNPTTSITQTLLPKKSSIADSKANEAKIVDFLVQPANWTVEVDRIVGNCFYIQVQSIGTLDSSFKDYFSKEYNTMDNGEMLANILKNTKQYVWQGIESYTIGAQGEGESNNIYIRPGDVNWYKIGIWSGPSSNPEVNCTQEESQIDSIVNNIKFL